MPINSNTKKLEILNTHLAEMPEFFFDFIQRYIKNTTTLNTKIAYCKDTKIFLEFLMTLPKFSNIKSIKEFTPKDLNNVTKRDIEDYLLYLENYKISFESRGGKDVNISLQNSNNGKMRKLSSLRSLFNYLFTEELISKDVSRLVRMPKAKEQIKPRLAVDEVATLLDTADSGEGLTEKQKQYFNKTHTRDMCILTILLGTGIRVSELVNINLKDISLSEGQFKVTRKGENEDIIYCTDEVLKAIQDYYDERMALQDKVNANDQDAFILSSQLKRINEKTVRNLVKKYSRTSGIIKNITPHALRRTFGTNLYNEKNDIYLVAELLGHKSVETTRKHYAKMDLDKKREALNEYKLRDKNGEL